MTISTGQSNLTNHRLSFKRQYLNVFILLSIIFLSSGIAAPTIDRAQAQGATLTFSPVSGEYFIGSTFETSLVLNTGNQAINAIQTTVRFPADKLQIVSLSRSFIEIWVVQPSFSNSEGTITLTGGLPNPGLTTSNGIITTVTFRVKSSGTAKITYDSNSKVLANDNLGTNILTNRREATYNLRMPAPEGPQVTSPTHPDSNNWYNNDRVSLEWNRAEGVTAFSYVFDNLAQTIPDEIPETDQTFTTLTAKESGLWYFHIRSRTDIWGGVTHFPVRIDNKPPAKFTPKVVPDVIPANQRGVLSFKTTDAASGVNYYEVKILSLKDPEQDTTIFTEESSPYLLPILQPGKYQAVVRAYDRAGNFQDGIVGFTVASTFLAFFTANPWGILLIVLLLLVIVTVAAIFSHRLSNRRKQLLTLNAKPAAQSPDTRQDLAAEQGQSRPTAG